MERKLGVVVRDTTIVCGGVGNNIFCLKVPRHCRLVLLIRVSLGFRSNSTFFSIFMLLGFSCPENREYGRRDSTRWPRGTLYPQKLAITSPTSGCRPVGTVRSRTQSMFFLLLILMLLELEGLHWNGILSDIRRATLGRNFNVTVGRAACEACSATWNLGTNSAFALWPRKTTENLNRVGRSQDLPDANWLLASSPALNPRALTLVPICAVGLLSKTFISLGLQTFLCAYHLDAQHTVYNTWENNAYLHVLICVQNTQIYICTWDCLNIGNFEEKRVMLYDVCCSSNNRDYIW
jgi:hypothetical protein